jgi:tetratricopeptide (TPR) repeat protein
MLAFPGDADVARLATNVYRQARDWRQMERAAQQWRSRSLERPAEADVAIAEARLAAGNAAGALQQLAPQAAAATAAPDANAAVLITYARALAAAGREPDARAVLEPLLTKSARWRGAWMKIAEDDLADGNAAMAWLDRVAPRVMSDTPGERFALAAAWHAVGSRWQQPRAYEAAKSILLPISEQPDASAEVYLLLASVLQDSGDVAGAEANYRKALAARPESTTALNNLAYLLLNRGGEGDLDQADKLAAKAVGIAPDVASFHDTLARVRLKSGDQRGALQSFQNALDLEPDHVEAMIGKATVLAALGERARLRELIQQIDATLTRKPALSAELKRELESARNSGNAAVDPA